MFHLLSKVFDPSVQLIYLLISLISLLSVPAILFVSDFLQLSYGLLLQLVLVLFCL